MKKWIPLLALAFFALACSKDDDREVLQQEPEPIVTDHSHDLPLNDEIRNEQGQ